MTAQASETARINNALALLGSAKRITALTDASSLARLCAPLFPKVRDEVLADHPWNEAIARAALPASADYVPPMGYSAAFELPRACLRWLPWQEDDPSWFEGEQEGRFILSSCAAPIFIRYIARIEDVALWSPGLCSAIDAKLAKYLAKPVTGQTALIDRMEGLYQAELAAAKRQDGLATGKRNDTASYRSNWLRAHHRRFSAHGR